MIRMERYSLLLALFSSMLFGQSDRGTITGTVSDPGGAMIPGARVTATALDTNTQYKGTTTAAGEYTLLSLPVGLYRVTIENEGFKTVIRGNVRLEVGATARIDAKLAVGAVQQSIEVTAQSSMLATDSAKVQNMMSDRLIEGLPTVV